MSEEPRRYTPTELLNANALIIALEEYGEHIYDINLEVFINRVGCRVYGKKVWAAMRKELSSENK